MTEPAGEHARQRSVGDRVYMLACEHRFIRFRPWPIKDRWRCRCGFVTRLYDATDRAMQRPIHRQMAVVVKGYNDA